MEKTLAPERNVIQYVLKDLPVDAVEYDNNQPRKDLSTGTAAVIKNLKPSIDRHGIQQPITVTEYQKGRYKIIEGHRRYRCAKELEFKTIPCLVYPKLSENDMEVRRYEMQNLRRPWKPLEKSDVLYSLKSGLGFKSNKELAEYIGISEWTAANYCNLRDQKLHLLSRLEAHHLNESFQMEIVKLRPHLCKVAGMEVDEIIDNILERIAKGNIKNSKEIRILKSAFIRIDLYADLLADYLNNPVMKTRELQEQILRNGFSWNVQKVITDVSKKKSKGDKLTEKETTALSQLRKLIDEVL